MKKVLVVYKRSFLESHRANRGLLKRLPPAARGRFLRADRENRRTIEAIFDFLTRRRIPFESLWRGHLVRRHPSDLIVTVGGDGTFFAASHYVDDTPILAVNSDPNSSLSLFSCADRSNFREKLDQALEGRLTITPLNRIEVSIGKTPHPILATNDVLFAHRNPAAMSRYTLAVDRGKGEEQRSSGIWIAAAGGSTAGIHAAGGSVMPITSRELQYRVREPYTWPTSSYRFLRGWARKRILIETRMTDSALWIDGSRTKVELELHDLVTLSTPGRPLRLLGYDDRRRRKLFGKEPYARGTRPHPVPEEGDSNPSARGQRGGRKNRPL